MQARRHLSPLPDQIVNTRILYVSKGEDSSSTRYRALQFFPRWKEHGYRPMHVKASGGLLATLNMLRQARQADAVIVLRKTFPAMLLWLLRRASRRLVFEFDDAIFCNTDGSPSQTRMSRFAAMVRACDHIIVGNDFLRRQATAFNPAVTIIPTCLDVARYQIDADKPTNTIDLVWIGSHSTKKYLSAAMESLAKAAERLPQLRLKIIADFDLPGQGIQTIPVAWSSSGEVHELASAHIGIAPMRDDDWSRGKCALKVIQYMAAGLPVVSSNVGANAEIVTHNTHGFLVSSDKDWVTAIERLGADDGLRKQMGEAGRRLATDEYSITSVFARLQRVIGGLLPHAPAG